MISFIFKDNSVTSNFCAGQGSNIHGRHGVNSRQSFEDIEKYKMKTVAKEVDIGNLPNSISKERFKAFLTNSLRKIGVNEWGGKLKYIYTNI